MTTMTLIHTADTHDDLLTISDTALEIWFSDAGLTVETVAHCGSAACSTCFPDRSELVERATRAA